MKKLILVTCIIAFCFFSDNANSQTLNWDCAVNDSDGHGDVNYIGSQNYNVVLVLLDFPDGRLPNGQPPATEQELEQVENIDAVLNMGYLSDNGTTFTKKVRKYTYDNWWNMFFTDRVYIGNEIHPDWMSHGRFDLPCESGGNPAEPKGDTARAWGSFKDWYREVSYGNVDIIAAQTHTTNNGIYNFGLVNNIINESGNVYVRPIMFEYNKSYYFRENNEERAFSEMLAEADGRVYNLHYNLPTTDPDYIEFDIQSFNGKIIYMFAGGTNGYGGLATANHCIVREKLVKNYQNYADRCVINGLTIYVHEFGHLLGFDHSAIGNYCAMTIGTDNQNCPSHFNILYKLKAGWIPPERVRTYNSISAISDLPPSEFNGDCALITIYGKAGYSEIQEAKEYNHSEYFIIENRRMLRDNTQIQFDKKFVWIPDNMPTSPFSFNGGCLIMHYSSYGRFPTGKDFAIVNANLLNPVLVGDEGHSNHFFAVSTAGPPNGSEFNLLGENRTLSSFGLPTGISLSNIDDPGDGSIGLNVNYNLGEPPSYTKVLYGQTLPNPFIMNGIYFLHIPNNSPWAMLGGTTIMQPGTVVEAVNGGLLYNSGLNGNFEANGTIGSPITFQGAGYQQYRLRFTKLEISNVNNSNSETNEIRNCNFVSQILNFELHIGNTNSNKSVVLENIFINGGADFLININNSISAVSINNITFASQPRKLTLSSTTNYQNQAVLSTLLNSDFDEYYLSGTWRLDLQNDFNIEYGKKLFISSQVGYKSEMIYTNPYKTTIDGEITILGSFNTNRDLLINPSGTCTIKAWDKPNSPSMDNFIQFPPGYGLYSHGSLNVSAVKDSLIFTVNGDSQWVGISCQNSGAISLNNVKIRNAGTGIEITNPAANLSIQNSHFSDNSVYDVLLSNFEQSSEFARIVSNNVFTGNDEKISSLYCNNGVDVNIESNQFDEDYSLGVSFTFVTSPVVKQNTFRATTTPGYSPKGIYSYTSGGFYSCNDLTNYSNAVELNNSSPYLFNNDIYNNGIGLYCVSASYPILTPAYSPGGTLYIGGYNRIHDNLEAEIHCENTIFIPNSLPVLGDGYNSIYDNNTDCLINLTGISTPIEYSVQNNYWGGGSPQNRLCPPSFTFVYEPYLSDEPQPPPYCDPLFQSANNSGMSQYTLQLGSANIDDYNGNYNSAVTKYKNLITFTNNPKKSYLLLAKIFYSTSKDTNADFYSLESYYSGLSYQYSTDTLFRRKSANVSTSADVEQPSYQEAIGEYQAIIDNPLNQVERHYAYIDQMRTIRLMLDSLLNGSGNGPMGGNYNRNEFKLLIQTLLNFKLPASSNSSDKNQGQKDNLNVTQKTENAGKLVSRITSKDKSEQLNNIRKTLNIENISFDNLSNHEKVSLLDKVLSFKLLEFSLLYNSPNARPLSRMSLQKRNSVQANNNLPKVFKLHQNYPNPFNPVCALKFDIPKESMVTIKIYDLLGREVTTLVNEVRKAGYYKALFDGSNYASGVYFYRIEARQVGSLTGGYVNVKKMVLMK